MSARARNRVALVLIVLGGAAGLVSAVAVYAYHVVIDRDGFADRVTEAVKQPAVRREVSIRLSDAFVDAVPDAVAAERPLEDTVSTLISTGALDAVVYRAALVAHDAVFTNRGKEVELDVGDGLRLVSSFLEGRSPVLGQELKDKLDGTVRDLDATLVRLENRGWIGRLTGIGRAVEEVALYLPLVAFVLFAAAIAVAAARRGAVFGIGIALVVVGAGLFLFELIVGRLIARGDYASPDTVEQLVGTFLSGLIPFALAIGAAGAVIAAAASGRLVGDASGQALEGVWGFVRRGPRRPWHQALRAVVLLALGVALLVEPVLMLEAAAVVVGLLALVEGVTQLIELVSRADTAAAGAAPSRRRMVVAGSAAAVAIVGLVAIALVAIVRPPTSAASITGACNGAPQLCDRPLDTVAFPTAHNAMSSAAAGFVDPNHRRSITQLLDGGIRGLLIDSLTARPSTRRAAALTVLDGEARDEALRQLGPEGLQAAEDLLARSLARPTGPSKPYLCHVVCELGALPMEDTLRELNGWLERNPREVLVIVIQDLVNREDTEGVFRRSGLFERVYTWDVDGRAPTLRELVDQDRRVLVMAEVGGFPDGWYQAGYQRLLKETPYDLATTAAFRSDTGCRANRGRERNPLFLVNHFVEKYPPRLALAKIVNERSFLLERLERCRRIRKAFPNLIAVDFAGVGDVVAVAAILNGLAPRKT